MLWYVMKSLKALMLGYVVFKVIEPCGYHDHWFLTYAGALRRSDKIPDDQSQCVMGLHCFKGWRCFKIREVFGRPVGLREKVG
jgi:hypothetical protein